MKIIDAHAHIVEYINGFGARGELRPLGHGMVEYSDGKKFQMFPEYMGDKGVTPESLLKIMDKNNVEAAVLLQGNWLGFQNLYVYDAMIKYPDRFLGACTIDPFCKERESIAKHLFEDLKFRIIKMEVSNTSGLMANHHKVDLYGDEMKFIYNTARKYNAIVTIDIGRPGNECYQVERLHEAIKEYSDVTFVICHLLCHPANAHEMVKENLTLINEDNVYFDISALPSSTKETYPFKNAQDYLGIAKDIIGIDKLMFGSDMPSSLSKASYNEYINYIIDSNHFTNNDLEKIFYSNAKRIYFNK